MLLSAARCRFGAGRLLQLGHESALDWGTIPAPGGPKLLRNAVAWLNTSNVVKVGYANAFGQDFVKRLVAQVTIAARAVFNAERSSNLVSSISILVQFLPLLHVVRHSCSFLTKIVGKEPAATMQGGFKVIGHSLI